MTAALRHSELTTPCREQPDAWFDSAQFETAVRLCETCPLMEACRELGRSERWGVWGGEVRDQGVVTAVAAKRTAKRCPRCGVTKPVSAFSPAKARPDGLRSALRVCCAEQERERRARKRTAA